MTFVPGDLVKDPSNGEVYLILDYDGWPSLQNPNKNVQIGLNLTKQKILWLVRPDVVDYILVGHLNKIGPIK